MLANVIFNSICTPGVIQCSDSNTKHYVPNDFPKSSSCQICATSEEMQNLRIQYFFTKWIPRVVILVLLYVLASLINIRTSTKQSS